MSAKMPATYFNKDYAALDPRTVEYAATIELRTHAEMLKGPSKGRGFGWVCVEDIKVNDTFGGMERARKLAVEQGLCSAEEADKAGLIMVNVLAQYGADGKATVIRTFNPHTQRLSTERVF